MTSTHVTVSHGSDFFGVDTIPVRDLRHLGEHVRGVLPATDYPPLTRLLDDAGDSVQTLDTDQATLLAALLHRAADHRRLRKPYRGLASLLGIAAANAADDGEPWTWTPTTGGANR
ncbi:hypothetical protein ACIQGT_40530 [Streptomyces sp. NPDC093108]|uniref:DUF7739 domain-containing protein n=1 Tax=Streptomyces sp. NPDC093108 TaxID=3366030 RepID=UPI003806B619